MNFSSKRASEDDFERLIGESSTPDLSANRPEIMPAHPASAPVVPRAPAINPALFPGVNSPMGDGINSAVLSAAESPLPADVNPVVTAGKVRWHADFATACLAAGRSGKPIFLFQMMGRLDQKFC